MKTATKSQMAELLFQPDQLGHSFDCLGKECQAENLEDFAGEVERFLENWPYVVGEQLCDGLTDAREFLQQEKEWYGRNYSVLACQMPTQKAMRQQWRTIKEWRKK